jgi:gamma-glutamyltranspeptidase/glutathione hydrolase
MRSVQRVDRDEVVVRHGAVAATRRAQAEAGVECLREGGSAVDAAVCVGFLAAVMEPMETCVGGAGFMLVHDPTSGRPHVFEFPPRAPMAATPDMFEILEGDTRPNTLTVFAVRDDANAVGYRAAAVPGLVAAMVEAHRSFGRLPLHRVLEPAIAMAEDGFDADYYYCWIAAAYLPTLVPFPSAAATFLDAGRVPAAEPFLKIRQRALADTLRQVAKDGGESFYRGDLAASMAADVAAGGGILTREDLSSYQVEVTGGLSRRYRGLDVVVPTAPGGHWTELQILQLLSRFDLAGMGHGSADALHTLIEASRLAFADRYHHLGDPDFEPIPLEGLLSDGYADQQATLVRPGVAGAETPGDDEPWSYYAYRATHDPWPHDPAGPTAPKQFARVAPAAPPSSGTTHFCAVDEDRMLVSCTHTAAHPFGAKFLTESGVVFNAGMNWFTAAPGAANSIAGGKRPVVNMGPMLVLRDGRPHMALGAPGGRRIIGALVQILSNVADHGMSMQPACSAPRTDSSGRMTFYDDRIDPAVVEDLAAMGHRLQAVNEEANATGYEFAHPTSILVGDDGRVRCGVDPVRKMEAVGY